MSFKPVDSSVKSPSQILRPFDTMPNEILLKILSFLDVQELPRHFTVSKKFSEIGKSPMLVKNEIAGYKILLIHLNKKKLLNKVLPKDYKHDKWIINKCRPRLKNIIFRFKESQLASFDPDITGMDAPLINRIARGFCTEAWRRKLIGNSKTLKTILISYKIPFTKASFQCLLQAYSTRSVSKFIEIQSPFSIDQIKVFTQWLKKTPSDVESISINSHPPLKRESMQLLLKGIGQSKYIKAIRFSHCLIDDSIMESLQKAIKVQSQIVRLNFEFVINLTQHGVMSLVKLLKEHQHIKELSIVHFNELEVRTLIQSLNETNLQMLSLNNGLLSSETMKLFVKMVNLNQSLRVVNLLNSRP